MSILVTCPGCQAQIHAAESRAGGSVECDFCGTATPVPRPERATQASAGETFWGINFSTFATIAGVMFLLGMAALILLPTISESPAPGRRSQCINNLRQIGLALNAYHSEYGSFPPAYVADAQGKPLYSWRVLILPHLEEKRLYDAFDKDAAWDAQQNIAFSQRDYSIFRCPAAYSSQPGTTSYVVIIDPEFAFTGGEGTKLDDIHDGTSNTIAVIEVDWAIPWTSPLDPTGDELLDAIDDGRLKGSHHSGVFPVVFCDVHCRALPVSIDRALLRAMLTRSGGEKIDEP